MFQSSKIFIKQDLNGGKWVKVTLLKAHWGGHGRNAETWGDYYSAFADGYSYSGRWRLGANSTTNSVEDAYTVGSSVPQKQKFWRFSPKNLQLDFVELATMTGGSGGFGSTTNEIQIAVTLSNAMLSKKGLTP